MLPAASNQTVVRALKIGSRMIGVTLVALLLVSAYATELTRYFVPGVAESPLALPTNVDIRYSDGLVGFIGAGALGGRAQAVTLGHVIVVPTQFEYLSDRRGIAHTRRPGRIRAS